MIEFVIVSLLTIVGGVAIAEQKTPWLPRLLGIVSFSIAIAIAMGDRIPFVYMVKDSVAAYELSLFWFLFVGLLHTMVRNDVFMPRMM